MVAGFDWVPLGMVPRLLIDITKSVSFTLLGVFFILLGVSFILLVSGLSVNM